MEQSKALGSETSCKKNRIWENFKCLHYLLARSLDAYIKLSLHLILTPSVWHEGSEIGCCQYEGEAEVATWVNTSQISVACLCPSTSTSTLLLTCASACPYLIFVISFTQTGFSKTKFYTQKKRLKAPKTLKMYLKKSNIYFIPKSLVLFMNTKVDKKLKIGLHSVDYEHKDLLHPSKHFYGCLNVRFLQ